MHKYALEHALASMNWWMGISTIAVAVGVLGEFVAVLFFDTEIRRNKLRMSMFVLSSALVVGGVMGEYVLGKHLSQHSESRQQAGDREVAQANAKAEQARQEAAATMARVKAAEERSKENGRASARLRRLAEQEPLARLQFEATTAARRLTTDVRTKLVPDLQRYRGQHAKIIYRANDLEASNFAADIHQVLEQAKWFATGPEASVIIISLTSDLPELQHRGVWLEYTPDGPSLKAAQALTKLLTIAGFDARASIVSPLAKLEDVATVFLMIEPRPRGAQGKISQ